MDVEHDFEPTYEVVADRTQAGRRDRQGRPHARTSSISPRTSIARARRSPGTSRRRWALPEEKTRRVTFSEITEPAIRDAFAHPRGIDLHLVDAQQARRVVDRLVGYTLSPLLWRKVRSGLSAGRVSSRSRFGSSWTASARSAPSRRASTGRWRRRSSRRPGSRSARSSSGSTARSRRSATRPRPRQHARCDPGRARRSSRPSRASGRSAAPRRRSPPPRSSRRPAASSASRRSGRCRSRSGSTRASRRPRARSG